MTFKSTARRVVIYCRISDDREGRQYGVDRQERQCRDLAARNGDEVVAVFVDDDRSAYSGKPRPDYIRMLELLRSGTVDGVYSLAPTRLYRRLDDGLDFLKLIQARGLAVETVKAGRYNLSTADGRRDALRAAVDAQHETEQISERVRDAKSDNLARGEYRGGPRPFGWDADGVTPRSLVCPTVSCANISGFDVNRVCLDCGADGVNLPGSEFWHIERGVDGIIAGESLRSLVTAANADGSRTPARRFKQPDGTRGEPESREWEVSTFRPMLLRARNAGLIEHDGEIMGRAQWAAAVPEEKWRAAKAILENPTRRTSPGNARVWLLSGIARCWCGEPVKCTLGGVGTRDRVTGKREHYPTYRCRASAKHISRRTAHLDSYIVDLALERLSRPDAAALLLPPAPIDDAGELATQANALRAKLDSITADYNDDQITRKQMIDMTAATRAKLAALEARMADRMTKSVLASVPLGTPEVADEWAGYHLDKRRAIITALMTVTVQRARRGRPAGFKVGAGQNYFDTDTITVKWLAGEA